MPRKTQRSDNVVRSVTHPVKFNSLEYGQIKSEAYKKGVTVAELIRSAALRRKVTPLPPQAELDSNFHKELHAIGLELNQITKEANRTLKAGNALVLNIDQLTTLLERLGEVLEKIQSQLKERSPQLPIESRRFDKNPLPHVRSIRLTPDEYELLKQKAHTARTSVTKFLRRAALRLQVVEPPPPPASHWKIHSLLSDILNNLNQLYAAVERATVSGQQVGSPTKLVVKLIKQMRLVGLQLLDATDEEVESA